MGLMIKEARLPCILPTMIYSLVHRCFAKHTQEQPCGVESGISPEHEVCSPTITPTLRKYTQELS